MAPVLDPTDMPISAASPFKGRHFPDEIILLCVRWYLRYLLVYEHVGVLTIPGRFWR